MSKVDDELTRRLRRAERPVDGDELFEQIRHRRHRLEVARRAQIGALAVAVLVFTTGGFVALTSTFGGQPAPIGTSPHPILPKENGLLAFADGSSLFTISPDGGELSRVSGIPEGVWSPAWSPDGTRLAVAIFPLGPGRRELWVVDADGSGATKLAEADNVSQPSWSPDGSMIAYAADDGDGSAIHVIGADGTDDHVVGEVLHGPDYFSAAFSPDGTQILFDKGTDSGFAIFVMGSDGSRVTRVSAGDRDYDPSWSPDGSKIAFTRQEEGAESDVFVMNADGSAIRRLTEGPSGDTNLHPTWSPDSSKIAYVSGKSGGPGGLVLVDPDGGDPREIVEDGVLGIAWQPLPADSGSSPTVSPEPSDSPSPEPEGRDIGLGFSLCDVRALGGIDFLGDGTGGRAWTGTRVLGDGSCPMAFDDRYGVAVDFTGDGLADSWSTETIKYCGGCEPFKGMDLNGDGREELIVILQYFSIMQYGVYTVINVDGEPQVVPFRTGEPGHPEHSLDAGKPFSFWVGGDAGLSDWFFCETLPTIWLTSTETPVEARPGDVTTVHETEISLGIDGIAEILYADTYTVPAEDPLDLPRTSPDHSEPDCGLGVGIR